MPSLEGCPCSACSCSRALCRPRGLTAAAAAARIRASRRRALKTALPTSFPAAGAACAGRTLQDYSAPAKKVVSSGWLWRAGRRRRQTAEAQQASAACCFGGNSGKVILPLHVHAVQLPRPPGCHHRCHFMKQARQTPLCAAPKLPPNPPPPQYWSPPSQVVVVKPKVVVCPPEVAKICWCATQLGVRLGWGAGSEGRRLRSLPQAAAARTYLLTRTESAHSSHVPACPLPPPPLQPQDVRGRLRNG